MRKNCLICNKEFKVKPSVDKKGNGKYCSKKCFFDADTNWKGGRLVDHRGYVHIRRKNHSYNNNGYVREHRLVMEQYLGRYLEPKEVVDHINGIKDDNRLENLKLFSGQADHIKVERERGVYKGSHQYQERDQFGKFI